MPRCSRGHDVDCPRSPCLGERDGGEKGCRRHTEMMAIRSGRRIEGKAPTAPDHGRLRVGLWAPVLYEAGAESWMLTLARSLVDRVSWRGLAVAGWGDAAASPRMASRFGPYMPVGWGRDACRALAAECDVIVSWAIPDVPELLARLPSTPKVVNVCHSPLGSEWGVNSYRDPAGIDAYVAVSELALGPICESRRGEARVIWNAVDEPRMKWTRGWAEMRESWGVPPGAKVAGYYGRLSPEKDPLAMARMVASLPDRWHAVIVGEGPQRAAVGSLAASLGVSDRIHVAGPDHEAGDVLHAFDCLVVPSEYESFGLTLAEGLWMGLPVVSTPVGLAKLVSGLTREVPIHPDGPTLASAVLADEVDRVGTFSRISRGMRFAADRLSLARFGREWGDFLGSLSLPRAVKLARVNACPDRGTELPASDPVYESGCCGSTRWECRSGQGSVAGKPTLRDCLECVGLNMQGK